MLLVCCGCNKGKVVNKKILKSKLSLKILYFSEADFEDKYEIKNNKLSSKELKDYLDNLSADELEFGMLLMFSKRAKTNQKDNCYDVLKNFCINNNVDLFIIYAVSKYIPPDKDFANWVVKSTKSIYSSA